MWIPNADIREYFQFWFPNIPDNCNKGVVGLIKNETNEKIKIEIVIDDLWMIENHQRNCTLYVSGKTYLDDCIIFITKEFFDAAINKSPKFSFLWHEVGHFHTNRYFPEYFGPELSRLRREYINKGQVYPAEYVGDLFAAYYSGKDIVYEALRQATRERHRLTQVGETNSSLAWWELRRRKRAIQKIQSDKEIEEELCKLCNVPSIDVL